MTKKYTAFATLAAWMFVSTLSARQYDGELDIDSDGKISVRISGKSVAVKHESDGSLTIDPRALANQSEKPAGASVVKLRLRRDISLQYERDRWIAYPDSADPEKYVVVSSESRLDTEAQIKISFIYWEFFPLVDELGNLVGGVERHHDAFEAYKWARRAAISGDEKAMYFVGRCYANGWGPRTDSSRAAEWYLKSAELGYEASQLEVGRAYLEGSGVPKDEIEGYAYLVMAGVNNPKIREFSKSVEGRLSTAARLSGQQRARQMMQEQAERKKAAEEAIRFADKAAKAQGA